MSLKLTPKDQASFAAAYGKIHFAVEQVEAMSDEKGVLKPVTQDQIDQLKKTCCEALCAAGAIGGTFDEQKPK